MAIRVELRAATGQQDGRGAELLADAHALGVAGLTGVEVVDLFFLDGAVDDAAIDAIVGGILADPVMHRPVVYRDAVDVPAEQGASAARSVEVTPLPGVTDSEAETLLDAARQAGVDGLQRAASGKRYVLHGALSDDDVVRLASGQLANAVIQRFVVDTPIEPPFVATPPSDGLVETIALAGLDDAGLEAVSHERRLSLDVAEMRALQAWYAAEGREPTDVELETIAQTWSEHCVHKTFRARIDYRETDADGTPLPERSETVDGLLKQYIRAATDTVDKPWVQSAFVDNAGIVALTDEVSVAFKVETHNHPSALEPFGGANTGVGGCVRDVLGVSARPIANTDVLCFGPQDLDPDALPDGVLHPFRIAGGVVRGIEDYGNKMGIPTVDGAIVYDAGYVANPLVFCGCLGVLPTGSHRTRAEKGDLIVAFGGRTGRDGLRGATFSSMSMDAQSAADAGTAVQIGHPIHEKQCLEVVLRARDAGLYTAITDCGAGGFSSAVGEMGEELGAEVQLQDVPLKYPGLRPWEVWLSEAQERMVCAVPPSKKDAFFALCEDHACEATVLGTFTGSGRLVLRDGERVVGDLAMDFLHDGLPRREMQAVWTPPVQPDIDADAALLDALGSPESTLLALLASPNIRSREDVVRTYDHEVQGGTVVKPFVGPSGVGPSDASVVVPLELFRANTLAYAEGRKEPLPGVALSCGIAPRYGLLDPYVMAWAVLDEAVRSAVATGADPDRISVLDNFCWGNPRLPDRLAGLVRAARGCHDAAVAYGTPFISGKDSLNNEYVARDGERRPIPGTLLVSALGVVPDVRATVTTPLKRAGHRLYLLGETRGELGGSAVLGLLDELGTTPPAPFEGALERYRKLHRAIREGWVAAAHDCSDGGLGVALAEMAIGASGPPPGGQTQASVGLGLDVDVAGLGEHGPVAALFCESSGRVVLEVSDEHAEALEQALAGEPLVAIGRVTAEPTLRVRAGQAELLTTTVAAVSAAFRGHVEQDAAHREAARRQQTGGRHQGASPAGVAR